MASYKKSEATCENILDAAQQLFCEKGYTATTTRQIADRAGISRGNLTYHYHNKADIASEISHRFYKSFFNEILDKFGDINDIILRDSIHLAVQMRLFMSKNKYMDFYNELDKYRIQSKLAVDMNFKHFTEQVEYLGLDLSQGQLIGCATIFPSAINSLVHAATRKRMSEDEAVNMMHKVHLHLLCLDDYTIDKYIQKAHTYSDRTTWQLPSLCRIELTLHDETLNK